MAFQDIQRAGEAASRVGSVSSGRMFVSRSDEAASLRYGPREAVAPVEMSVIVPFKDAAPDIRQQLEALAAQEVSAPWEVIAVDDGSRDASRQIVERFRDRLNLRVIETQEATGQAHAYNVGARQASGRKLIFVDADDEVAPGYITAMAAGLDRYDFITSAFDHRALNPDWVQGAHGPAWRDPDNPIPTMFGHLPFTGGSIGISREIFEAVGGFPEDFRYALDIAFSWGVQRTGTELHFIPDAVYRVRYRSSLRGLYRQALSWGADLPLLYRRYRTEGMQRRPLAHTIKICIRLALQLPRARTRADLAPLIVQAGLLLGRMKGSLRHRVLFL